MLQLSFLVLAVIGFCAADEFVVNDSLQPRVILRGRLGLLSFCVGIVGLSVIALRSCGG